MEMKMSVKKHPAYKEELERCNYTLKYVEKTIKSIIGIKDTNKNKEKAIHTNNETSQIYIDNIIGSHIKNSSELKIRNLDTALDKPYFARIDFKEKNKSKLENLYIGKTSLMREEDQEMIIVDWRAPIANLYYEGRLGESKYKCPDGWIEGKLLLKRQYSINNGILEQIFDIDITTNDEFLQTYLGATAENRLKDIVSTIQLEQNQIIRANMWKPLIVQGAAGSGKTTIALHRIAYLIYSFEKRFVPENFMIIAPNKFFLNYISEVLPELGVERVKQSTFEEFVMELLRKKFKIVDQNEKLLSLLDEKNNQNEKELIEKTSKFKSSMNFKDVIDKYIYDLENSFIPKEDFKLDGITLFSYEEINELFLIEYKGKEKQYKGGIVVIPSYLSKGLEFDVVFVTDSENYGESDLDIKLLYVNITRALHKVIIYK
jgi:DNA helicase-2/ATP-dependent DNA helicase PcrA